MSLENYNFDGFVINLYVDEQGDWLAHFQELPNISAFGDTPEEALEELKMAWELVKRTLAKVFYGMIMNYFYSNSWGLK